jgi:hypothetical protein
MARNYLDLFNLDLEDLISIQCSIEGAVCSILKIDIKRLVLGLEARMTKEMSEAWNLAVKDVLDAGLADLETRGYTADSIDLFMVALGHKLKSPLTDKQAEIIKTRLKSIYRLSKEEAAKEVRVGFNFSAVDQKAVDAVAGHQKFWIGSFFDEHLSQRIREVSNDVLLNQGLSYREAGPILRDAIRQEFGLGMLPGMSQFAPELHARYAGNPDLYFQQVASVSGHQSRVIARITQFAEAGVVMFQLINPMDERTSPICRELNGTVFSIDYGTEQIKAIVAADTPDAVKEAAPWLSAKDIKSIIGDSLRGSPEAARKLAGRNIVLPPFHPRCRTEPVMISIGSM